MRRSAGRVIHGVIIVKRVGGAGRQDVGRRRNLGILPVDRDHVGNGGRGGHVAQGRRPIGGQMADDFVVDEAGRGGVAGEREETMAVTLVREKSATVDYGARRYERARCPVRAVLSHFNVVVGRENALIIEIIDSGRGLVVERVGIGEEKQADVAGIGIVGADAAITRTGRAVFRRRLADAVAAIGGRRVIQDKDVERTGPVSVGAADRIIVGGGFVVYRGGEKIVNLFPGIVVGVEGVLGVSARAGNGAAGGQNVIEQDQAVVMAYVEVAAPQAVAAVAVQTAAHEVQGAGLVDVAESLQNYGRRVGILAARVMEMEIMGSGVRAGKHESLPAHMARSADVGVRAQTAVGHRNTVVGNVVPAVAVRPGRDKSH